MRLRLRHAIASLAILTAGGCSSPEYSDWGVCNMSPPPSAAAAVAACTRLIEAAPRVVESGRLGGDSLADAYIEPGFCIWK